MLLASKKVVSVFYTANGAGLNRELSPSLRGDLHASMSVGRGSLGGFRSCPHLDPTYLNSPYPVKWKPNRRLLDSLDQQMYKDLTDLRPESERARREANSSFSKARWGSQKVA